MPIISKEELLKKQEENSIAQKAAQKERFTKAVNEFLDEMRLCCEEAIIKAGSFPTYFDYVILDASKIKKQFQGYSYTTLLYGFWDREARCFKDTVLEENGIDKPFETIHTEYLLRGFKLCNESQTDKKNNLVLKLYWKF